MVILSNFAENLSALKKLLYCCGNRTIRTGYGAEEEWRQILSKLPVA